MSKSSRYVLALLLVAASTCSHAQFGGGMGGGGMGAMGGGGRGRGAQKDSGGEPAVVRPLDAAAAAAQLRERLLDLRLLLRITAEQAPAWSRFSNAVWALGGHTSVRVAQAVDGQSAPDVFRLKAEQAEDLAQRLLGFSQAVDQLYAVMTPEQRITADAQLAGALP